MTPAERGAAMVRLLTPFGVSYGARLHAAVIAVERRYDFVVIIGPTVYGASAAEMPAVLAVEMSVHAGDGTIVIVPLDDESLQVT